MTVNDSGQYDTETPAGRAKIVGVGKAGCTIADRIAGEWKNPPVVVAISTNGRVLTNSRCPVRLQIGKSITRGLGAGGDPEIGRQAAHKDLPLITELFADTDLVFVIVGLGGGTGTGAGPAVIRAAHEAGAMTLSVAALPFEFEGAGVRSCAQAGLRNLLEATDVGVVVPNDSVVGENSGDVPLKKAFEMADEALCTCVYALWRLMSKQGLINLDFSDLHSLIRGNDSAYALGYGQSGGKKRAETAADRALACPLLGKGGISRAEALLVSIVGDSTLTLSEINGIMTKVKSSARETARIFMGASVDDGLSGKVLVTVLSSQYWRETRPSTAPSPEAPVKEGDQGEHRQMQTGLNFADKGKGRFKDIEPTILEGEDLDVPTFMRRGIPIER